MSAGKKTEVEVKLRVADAAKLRRRLEQLRARRLGRVHESNTLFDTAARALLRRGCLLRLRLEKQPRRRVRAVVTYKGPSAPEGPGRARYKVREEIEFEMPQPEAWARVLEAAGFRPTFRYEKFRTSYALPGLPRLHVQLDETPIGVYLELEGPRRQIDRAARLLGYSPRDFITLSYGGLYLNHCRAQGVEPGDMLFPRR